MRSPGAPLSLAVALLLATTATGAMLLSSRADTGRPGLTLGAAPVTTGAPHAHPPSAGAPVMPIASPVLRRPDGAPGPPTAASDAGATAPAPVRLRIPALGIDSTLGRVALRSDGTIEVPVDWDQPAWYTGGPAPGTTGPAVILGHLDSDTGPAIFRRLATLRPGDAVGVTRDDGSSLEFRVTRVGDYPRAQFPTNAVYGETAGAELRLITCAGAWDRSAHQYTHNVVVFASLG